jgi:ribosomal protein S18 acetylase RimI-like enzyme
VIQIRQARLADEDALARVDSVTWTADISPAPPPPPGTCFFGPGTLPEDVLVAERGAVIGYAKLTQAIPLASHEHVLMLSGLAVDPDRQRAGAGRRLVEAITQEARARGARKLSLRVLGPNTAARGLYAACGFVIEGTLQAEFLLGGRYVDDLLMARYLIAESQRQPG